MVYESAGDIASNSQPALSEEHAGREHGLIQQLIDLWSSWLWIISVVASAAAIFIFWLAMYWMLISRPDMENMPTVLVASVLMAMVLSTTMIMLFDRLRLAVPANEAVSQKRNRFDLAPAWKNRPADCNGKQTEALNNSQADERIFHLAYYDQLTGLPNKRMMYDLIWSARFTSEQKKQFGALLFLDLDNFKNINDTMGHGAGDQLLIEVSRRIRQALRVSDTVSRFGGDEFVVLLEGLGDDLRQAANHAGQIGDNLLSALARPYMLFGTDVECTASIGVNMFCGAATDFDDLLRCSDVAMYEAKKSGRNALCFFDAEMQDAIEKRACMEHDLRSALKNGEFELYYQKRIDHMNRVIGAEALLRWRHPVYGVIAPGEFIFVAEQTGLIKPIGRWVLENACEQLRQWGEARATRKLILSVNVSANEFKDKDYAEQVSHFLRQSGVNPCLLELELTESMLLDDMEGCITKMHALKDLGVSFALDDFGTGYSSLSYLRKLPLDMLKIDQSFVRDLGQDENDEVIVQTIIQMGRSLGLNVLAEGVENPLQRVMLEQFGCNHYQGYLFGKPEPIEMFEQSLQEHRTMPENIPVYSA